MPNPNQNIAGRTRDTHKLVCQREPVVQRSVILDFCISVIVWSACELFAASVWLRANPKEHIGTRWPATEGLVDTIQEAVAQNRQCEPIGGSKVGREFRIDAPAVGPRRAEHNVVAYGQA